MLPTYIDTMTSQKARTNNGNAKGSCRVSDIYVLLSFLLVARKKVHDDNVSHKGAYLAAAPFGFL